MKRFLSYAGLLLMIGVCFLIVNNIVGLFASRAAPLYQENMRQIDVHAYRNWQRVGIRVAPGELLEIRAEGEWLYTPGEYHGPEGHPRYPAPSFYPVAQGAGGTLIGRIGDHGAPFIVGRQVRQHVNTEGTLYLRINDDILSDNKGSMLVEVTITPANPDYR